jgi:hypothetical protein
MCFPRIYTYRDANIFRNQKLSSKTSQLEKVTGANGRQWGTVGYKITRYFRRISAGEPWAHLGKLTYDSVHPMPICQSIVA